MAYDREFDGIIIGGGHQALVTAAYMAKAGQDILVLERALEVGGGTRTHDPTARGFRFNMHSNAHWNITGTPWYNDLELEKHGVYYIRPEYEYGLARQDDVPVVLGRNTERTAEMIANVSEHDAEEFTKRRAVGEELVDNIYMQERFDEPLPADERQRLLENSELGQTFLDWTTESSFGLMADWFESPEVQLLILHKMTIFGEPGEGVDNPSTKGGIARCFDGSRTYELSRGGSQMLSFGLQQVFQQNGGTVLTNSAVSSIEIEDGRAVGVTTTDGRSYGAKKFVSSGVNPYLTFKEFIGLENLDESFAAEVEGYDFTDWSTLTIHFALDDAPDYTGADQVPEINESIYKLVGIESLQELGSMQESMMNKEVPPPGVLGSTLTRFDDSLAPDGKHSAFAMTAGPYDLHNDPDAWHDVKEEVRDQTLETWGEYAPNMTEDNVVASNVFTPGQIPVTNPNMHEGCIMVGELNEDQILSDHFGYRTPIDGLFMCGSSVHPGGGINGGAGYVAAKVIHEYLGDDPWWDPVDAKAALSSLD